MVLDKTAWLKGLDLEQNEAINDVVAKHKADWDKKVKDAEAQLELLKSEKTQLAQKIEDEKKSKMTDEEKRTMEIAQIKNELASIKTERDRLFQERQNEVVASELTKAASKYQPRNVEHVLSLLKPQVQLVDGKITLQGKPVDEVLKSMKDSADTGYLFQGEPVKGSGIKPTLSTTVSKSDLASEIEAMMPKH